MIAALWTILTTNKLARALGIAVMAILGVLTFGAVKKREGAKGERTEAKQKDVEHAQDIRDRVVTGRPDRLQSVKDRGYRD